MKIRNWDTFAFVVVYHGLIIGLLPLFIAQFSWAAVLLFLITYVIGGLSITAGYHRLYAHKAYAANPVFEWCILLGSALSWEMSALMWSHDHRLHHNHVDTDKDPYSIKKGFWYAHLLWLFDYKRKYDPSLVADLLKNPRVVFQDKYYVHLVLIVNLAVFALGCLWVGPFASFYMGFLIRMAMIHHSTWFINSLCHTIGSKTYARELTAVDNAILALLTFGEGYHNYHHAFAADYRNGIRWYHFDPTKWLIWTASKFGMAKNLRVINTITLQKSLVLKDKKMIIEHLSHLGDDMDELASELKARLEDLAARFDEQSTALMLKIREMKKATAGQREKLVKEIHAMRSALKQIWNEWLEVTRMAAKEYQLAH
ncbi:acyl-CoA desaturase [Coraliomargarita parva]|uniref:acyl-CoA desaturase n=1 Tax=Coraliomargarita parva TaxID=3014050 RepID=UPI0022B45413|nr:fatty acid desaturase [Coraliomargarita parva]